MNNTDLNENLVWCSQGETIHAWDMDFSLDIGIDINTGQAVYLVNHTGWNKSEHNIRVTREVFQDLVSLHKIGTLEHIKGIMQEAFNEENLPKTIRGLIAQITDSLSQC